MTLRFIIPLAVVSTLASESRISGNVRSGRAWDFSTDVGPKGFKHHGHAESCEAAKADVERNSKARLEAAALSALAQRASRNPIQQLRGLLPRQRLADHNPAEFS